MATTKRRHDRYARPSSGKAWPLVRRLVLQHRVLWITAAALMLLSTVLGLGMPLAIRYLLDEGVLTGEHSSALWQGLGILVAILALELLANLWRDRANARLAQTIGWQLRAEACDSILELEYGHSLSDEQSDMVNRIIYDVEAITEFLSYGLVSLLQQPLTLVAGYAVLFVVHPIIGAASLAIVPVLYASGRVLGRRIIQYSRRVREAVSQMAQTTDEAILGCREIRVFGLQPLFSDRFRQSNNEIHDEGLTADFSRANMNAWTGLTSLGVMVIVFGLGGIMVARGSLTIGGMVALLLYLRMMVRPLRLAATHYGYCCAALASAERLVELEEASGSPSGDAPVPPLRLHGRIEFDHITFGYDDRHPVVRNVTFDVQPGQQLGIMGPSGSGKTTLLNLLCGFWDPQEGQIRVDGRDLRSIPRETLWQHIALVPQDTHLFNLSIRENIRLGRPTASEEEIVEAARQANVHDFVCELPDGYDSLVGKRGTRLSAGQRQRIAVARALLKDPPILVLDEPTAALDLQAEKEMRDALRRITTAKTVVIVGHHPDLARDVSRLIVLRSGRIVKEAARAAAGVR